MAGVGRSAVSSATAASCAQLAKLFCMAGVVGSTRAFGPRAAPVVALLLRPTACGSGRTCSNPTGRLSSFVATAYRGIATKFFCMAGVVGLTRAFGPRAAPGVALLLRPTACGSGRTCSNPTGRLSSFVATAYRGIATKFFCMAGVVGFEPTNAGIKTRCLATWRHPNNLLFTSGQGLQYR